MKYAIALITALAGSSAMAQQNCAPHAFVVDRLAQEYGESRQIIGLGSDNSVLEIFAAEGGSWTVTVTRPGGPTCMVAAGQAYQYVDEPLPPLGEPG